MAYLDSPQRFSSRSSISSDTFSRAEGRRSFLDNSFDATQRPSPGLAPYVDGRRNSSFVHPNLTSNNVFYDFEYAYKGNIPDPKVYRTTQDDRKSVKSGSLSARYSTTSYEDVYQPKTERQRRDLPVLNEEETEVECSVKSGTSHGIFCPDCINKHLRSRKVDPTPAIKQQERDTNEEWHAREEKRDIYNYDKERAQRVIRAKQAQEEYNYKTLAYFKQMNEKRLSKEQGGQVIHSIFDKQEERTRQMKEMERTLRSYNYEKMNTSRREDNTEGLNGSLLIGEGYSNKYLPHPETVRAHLKKQVSDNLTNKMKQKDVKKIL